MQISRRTLTETPVTARGIAHKYFRRMLSVGFLVGCQFAQAALVLTNQTFTVLEDPTSPHQLDVLSDTAAVQTDASNNSLVITGSLIYNGTGTVSVSNNQISYQPAENFVGTETISFEVTDGDGFVGAAVATVTVSNVNDAPIPGDDAVTVSEDSSNNLIPVLNNDTDIDPGTSTLTLVSIQSSTSNGTATVSGNNIVYTPVANFSGTDTVTYLVSDQYSAQATGTLSITVEEVNDPPVAVSGAATVKEDSSTLTIDIIDDSLVSDIDSSLSALTVSSVQVSASAGSVTANGSEINYTPAANYNGTAAISYVVSDNDATNPQTVTGSYTVTVSSVNDSPVAVADRFIVNEDELSTLNLVANDTDVDTDTLTIKSVGKSANGATIAIDSGSLTVSYTSAADFSGEDSFTYTIRDPSGATSTATVTVNVDPVNDPPVSPTITESVGDNTQLVVDFNEHISDVDSSEIAVTEVSTPVYGEFTLAGNTLTYTPFPNIGGTQTETLTYTVSDSAAATDGTLRITVTTENDAPTPVTDTVTVSEDSPEISIDVMANDTDPDGDTISLTTIISSDQGATVSVSNGIVKYEPAENFFGTETITYEVSDPGGLKANGRVTVTVTAVNDSPVITTTPVTIAEDTTGGYQFDVVSSGAVTDVDNTSEQLEITSLQINSGAGTVSGVGHVIEYTPRAHFSGTATITFSVSDGEATTTGTQTIEVSAVADGPVAVDDRYLATEDTAATIDVLSNDTDVDGDTLYLTAVATPSAGGTVSIVDNAIAYTPAQHFNGTETIVYTVSDADGTDPENPGLSDTGLLTITVSAVFNPAIAVDDEIRISQQTSVGISPLENDLNPDNLNVIITGVSKPAGGSVYTDGSTITYTPSDTFSGLDSFTYTIGDGTSSWSSEATVDVHVVGQTAVSECDTSSAVIDTDCGINPTDFRVQVYGFGLCTSTPIAPTTSTPMELSSCQLLYDGLSGGNETISFGQTSSKVSFSGAITPPPFGNYTHAVLVLSNSFDMKGAVELAGATPVSYCVTQPSGDGSAGVVCTASSASEAQYVTDTIDYFYDENMYSYRFAADKTDMYLTDGGYSLISSPGTGSRVVAIQELPSPQNFSAQTSSINIGLKVSDALVTDGTQARTAPFGMVFTVH